MASNESDDPSTDVIDDVTTEGLIPIPRAEETALRGATLIMLTGTTVGRRFALAPHSTLGRAAENTIVIDDPKVSREHAQMILTAGGWLIRDCKSRNGVVVNGARIEGDHVLHVGDEIHIGEHTSFSLSLPDALQEQALQRQKMEAIGRLGAGVAHDFNNLLGAALATLDNLASLPPKTQLGDPEVVECLDDVRAAALRATELTKRLLRFSRRDTMDSIAIDISKLCREVIQLVRRTVDRRITVEEDVDQRLMVDGHSGELHQVLMNLCINARDAMPTGGTLTIAAQLVPEEALIGLPVQQRLPHVALRVSDTGLGMAPEVLKNVFEPFFTTKSKETGAGLGLATVFAVATRHGGTVTIDSEPGVGTTVRVFLPTRPSGALRPRTPTAGILRPLLPALADSAQILIVDDQALIRRSWQRLLERAGHEVRLAEHGQEALELLKEEVPDLVFLDLDMPVLDGVATLERLRQDHPRLPVVCVSGHWEADTEARVRALGALDAVEKPLSAARLLELVSRAATARDLHRTHD